MKFILILSLFAVSVLVVLAQEKDLVSGHYRFSHQNNFEVFLKAYGITDETKIKAAASSKPELIMQRNGDLVTVTFMVSPTKNATFSFTLGQVYEADFFGVGKTERTITTIQNGNSIMSREVDHPDHFRVGKYTETDHTMTFYSGDVTAERVFERL